MTQAFVSTGKSKQYWQITVVDEFCAIHFGKVGATGTWQLLENLDEDSAAESAADLIKAKQRAGFVTDTGFDPAAVRYFDDPEFGPHRLTSHPKFNEHFSDELYQDSPNEQSPFGSDDGADTLHDLQDALQADTGLDLLVFPEQLVTHRWEMQYHPPTADDEGDYWSIGGPGATDQAIVATVFGAVKVTGKLSPELKALGLQSLRRWQRLGTVGDGATPAGDSGNGDIDGVDSTLPGLARMTRDLETFPVS